MESWEVCWAGNCVPDSSLTTNVSSSRARQSPSFPWGYFLRWRCSRIESLSRVRLAGVFAYLGGSMLYAPMVATIQKLVPEHMRATMLALGIDSCQHSSGWVSGPSITGALSDLLHPWVGEESLRIRPSLSLSRILPCCLVCCVAGGAHSYGLALILRGCSYAIRASCSDAKVVTVKSVTSIRCNYFDSPKSGAPGTGLKSARGSQGTCHRGYPSRRRVFPVAVRESERRRRDKLLKALVETFALLRTELQSKQTSVERLQRMLLKVPIRGKNPQGSGGGVGPGRLQEHPHKTPPEPKTNGKSATGVNAAAAYTGGTQGADRALLVAQWRYLSQLLPRRQGLSDRRAGQVGSGAKRWHRCSSGGNRRREVRCQLRRHGQHAPVWRGLAF